jgi:hypothetical protein
MGTGVIPLSVTGRSFRDVPLVGLVRHGSRHVTQTDVRRLVSRENGGDGGAVGIPRFRTR